MKWGKWILRIIVMSIIAAILLAGIGWLYNTVIGLSITWGSILGVVLAIILFSIAIAFNPGKETVIEYLPVLLIVTAVIGAIGKIWAGSPFSFIVEWSLVGLVLALSAVFLAGGITARLLKAID